MAVRKIAQKELENVLKKSLSGSRLYQEILGIVRQNSKGRIWLIGGWVYRTLAHNLYDCESPIKDFDFIVEKIKIPLQFLRGWQETKTNFGSPRLKKDNVCIDIVPLNNIYFIKNQSLEPNIENFLNGTPLTIQSIAFDVTDQILIGNIGIKSILNKTVGVNNQKEYDYAKSIYGDRFSVKRYVNDLGFTEE